MRNSTRAILLALLLLALPLWAQASSTIAPATGAPLPEDRPAYTLEQVRAIVWEVLPLVERVTERKLQQMPEIKVLTRQEYDRLSQPDPKRRGGRQNSSRSMAHYAFGAYDPRLKALVFLPGNFVPRLRHAGVPDQYYPVILKIIIAHELAHALQDQEAGLGTVYRRARTKEAWFAHRATIEGHATFVMGKVAEALGMPQAMEEFEKTIAAGLIPLTGPDHAMDNAAMREEFRSSYIDGASFIRWHYQHAGNERVWQIVKTPPLTRDVILRPELYRHDRPEAHDRPGVDSRTQVPRA